MSQVPHAATETHWRNSFTNQASGITLKVVCRTNPSFKIFCSESFISQNNLSFTFCVLLLLGGRNQKLAMGQKRLYLKPPKIHPVSVPSGNPKKTGGVWLLNPGQFFLTHFAKWRTPSILFSTSCCRWNQGVQHSRLRSAHPWPKGAPSRRDTAWVDSKSEGYSWKAFRNK